MSKKNKKTLIQASGSSSSSSHEPEYHVIKLDLIKVVALNLVYLIGILALYYTNRANGFLDNWFAKLLHF